MLPTAEGSGSSPGRAGGTRGSSMVEHRDVSSTIVAAGWRELFILGGRRMLEGTTYPVTIKRLNRFLVGLGRNCAGECRREYMARVQKR